jgi:hypothetical protein
MIFIENVLPLYTINYPMLIVFLVYISSSFINCLPDSWYVWPINLLKTCTDLLSYYP